jgi:uncharacterized repeat protein (TIGR01451 family)
MVTQRVDDIERLAVIGRDHLLAVGRSATVVIQFRLVGSPQAITNCAQVSSTTLDPNLRNNQSCVTLQMTGADLKIVKSATSVSRSGVSYSLSVANQGPQVAQSVVVSDTLPGQVQYGGSTPLAACTYNATLRVVTCQLGQLAVGQSATILIMVRPTSSQPFTNCAQVSSTTPDPNANDNRSCITIQIGTSSSLSIESPATGDSGSVTGFFRSIWGVLADLVVGHTQAAS